MAKETRTQVTAEEMAKAEALAKAAALKRTSLQARLANVKPEDIITNDVTTEVPRRNQYESGGWLHSPAMFESFAATEPMLMQAAEERGLSLDRIQRVRAAYIHGVKLAFIWPTTHDDPQGIEVNQYGSALMINLITVLGPARKRVPIGYKYRYDSYYASGAESPVGPAIYLDIARPREKKLEPAAKKSMEQQAAADAKKVPKKAKQKSETPAAPTEPTT